MQSHLINPASLESFGFDADVGGFLLSKQIEGQVTQDSQILIGISAVNAEPWLSFASFRKTGSILKLYQLVYIIEDKKGVMQWVRHATRL